MSVELHWADTAVPEFTETDEDADGKYVFDTWPQAKQAALESAIDNREQWAKLVRDLRRMTRKEALES